MKTFPLFLRGLLLAQLLAIGNAFADPVLLAVQSRKTHGAAGQYSLPVAQGIPITGAITVEPRAMGAGHTIVFQFDTTITSANVNTVSVVNGNGNAVGSASASFSGQELTVVLSALPDNIRVTVGVTGINGVTDVTASAGFLIGDSNSSASVSASDLSALRVRSGQLVTQSNFIYDVNASGVINASDIVAVKGRLGFNIPTVPANVSVAFAGLGGGSIVSNPAGLNCSAPCTRSFNNNSSIVLTAVPNAVSAFSGWSGACTGTMASTTLMVANGSTCTATFTLLPQFPLTVVPAGTGSGNVTSSPPGINCSPTCTANFVQTTSITLTATPTPVSAFGGWSGTCTGTSLTTTFTMNASSTCTATFTPIVPSGAHPRIWLDTATMSRLTAAATGNSAEWVRLKSFCDTNTLPTFEYQGDEQFRFAGNFSLCYRVVLARSGAAAAAPYAQKAINVLQGTAHPLLNFTGYSTDSGYGIRNYVPAMALIFDWLYDSPLLTPALKTAIIGRIQNWMDFYALSGYAAAEPISNYNSGYVLGGVLAGIAVYGESAQANAVWTKGLALFDAGRQAFDLTMSGGHWVEGWNYGTGVYERYLQSASAMKTGTGQSTYISSNWLNNNVTFKVNALTPDGKFFYDDGLWSGDLQGDPRYNDVIAAGYAFGWGSINGQIARAYVNKVVAAGNPLTGLIQWNAFLFYDPTSQPYNLTQLSSSYHAVGTGVVSMRSDWSDPAATWGVVTAGGPHTSYQGEQDKDQGHFEIYKSAPLLIDAGHGLFGDIGIKNTLFHNTFTFEGRTDNVARSYEGQLSLSGVCPNPLATPVPPNPSTPGSDPIGVNAFIDAGSYVFTSGEFSAAYQSYEIFPSVCGSVPVTWMNRNTFYLRPNTFVIYDQVEKISNQPALVPKMHLHFPTQPTPLAADNRQMSLNNGAGRLQVSTVFPAANTSLLQFEAVNTMIGPGVANWHLSVRYTDPSPIYQKFLTVLRAGASVVSNTFPTITAITGTNATGTLITGLPVAESNKPVSVVFADNGTRTIPTSITYQYASVVLTQHYVAKLKPNSFYSLNSSVSGPNTMVTITENASGTKTDAAGVLAFAL